MGRKQELSNHHGVHMNLEQQDMEKLQEIQKAWKKPNGRPLEAVNCFRRMIRNTHKNIDLLGQIEHLKESIQLLKNQYREELNTKDHLIEELREKLFEKELRENPVRDPIEDDFKMILGWRDPKDWIKAPSGVKTHIRPIIVKRSSEISEILNTVLKNTETNSKEKIEEKIKT
ncbi:hypothetical protein [Methanococcus maripaludis]|uniref:Uncharacterized protein n=1 Tax=Methanococcus maripaludis (strain DSM 14266 / JCM 13030 / NBRC 101832 / S2 / LL) TaxID=267377 RepID=Q6M006_METMP|nr:hypothetical protein [Methanococcus maripaludis]CAF30023.1 hypothetical protein MMP0467 [Methanococcus maripaludis S2]